MNVLVTGGAGYIGSHICIALLEAGHSVIVIDNLSNSNLTTLKKVKEITKQEFFFYKVDVTHEYKVEEIFSRHPIDAVIHLAGLKAVGDSVQHPLTYYFNNILGVIVLAKSCQRHGVKHFIFSSSATVYGENNVPFIETMELLPTTNPYGETKVMCERILIDMVKSNSDVSLALLRYFNPVGAHESGIIGDCPNGTPSNIMPVLTQVAKGKKEKLQVFGDDYPTKDGTAVRDYIHVMDLAEGHLAALNNLRDGAHIYNLGHGKGTSVLELIKTFERVNDIKIPYEFVDRRPGDIAVCYADISKAKMKLGWSPTRNISDMCRDAWRFEKTNMECMKLNNGLGLAGINS